MEWNCFALFVPAPFWFPEFCAHTFSLTLSYKWCIKNGFSFALQFFLLISDILGCVILKWIFPSMLLEEFTLFRSFEISCNTILNWQQKPLVFSENTIWSKGGSVEETIIHIILNIQQNLNFPIQKWESGLSFVFLTKKTEPSLQNTCSANSHWLKN